MNWGQGRYRDRNPEFTTPFTLKETSVDPSLAHSEIGETYMTDDFGFNISESIKRGYEAVIYRITPKHPRDMPEFQATLAFFPRAKRAGVIFGDGEEEWTDAASVDHALWLWNSGTMTG